MKQENSQLSLVSVIIPAYNCAEFIQDSITSVLNQGYGHLEIIVVDDESTDDTANIASAFGKPVRVIRQKNAGPAAARNTGMKAAQGEYIALLDGDDAWLPNKLHLQLAYLAANPEIGAVYGRWIRWYPETHLSELVADATDTNQLVDTQEINIVEEFSGWIYHQLLLDSCIFTSVFLARRTIMEQLGEFDESMLMGEDYTYWLKLSQLTQVAQLDYPLALYRIQQNSVTHRIVETNYEEKVVSTALKQWGRKSPGGTAIGYWDMKKRLYQLNFDFGYIHYHKGKAALAVQAFIKAIAMMPVNYRAWSYCILSAVKNIRQ